MNVISEVRQAGAGTVLARTVSGPESRGDAAVALTTTPDQLTRHANAFGFLRLLLASMVIVSHTPELVDGNQHRELLARLTGTNTFGAFGVAGFFVISGS